MVCLVLVSYQRRLSSSVPELHHKIARKVLWFDLATFLAPQPEQRRLVSPHNARQCALGVNTIRRAEVAQDATSLTAANEMAIRRAFEAAGIEFIDENGTGEGVRFHKPRRARGK